MEPISYFRVDSYGRRVDVTILFKLGHVAQIQLNRGKLGTAQHKTIYYREDENVFFEVSRVELEYLAQISKLYLTITHNCEKSKDILNSYARTDKKGDIMRVELIFEEQQLSQIRRTNWIEGKSVQSIFKCDDVQQFNCILKEELDYLEKLNMTYKRFNADFETLSNTARD